MMGCDVLRPFVPVTLTPSPGIPCELRFARSRPLTLREGDVLPCSFSMSFWGFGDLALPAAPPPDMPRALASLVRAPFAERKGLAPAPLSPSGWTFRPLKRPRARE